MRLPKSYKEITVEQYQECYFLLKDIKGDVFDQAEAWCNVVGFLSGVDPEKIKRMSPNQSNYLIKKVSFLKDEPKCDINKYVVVNKRIYRAIHEANKLSTAQVMDIKSFLTPDEGMDHDGTVIMRLHKLLASVYLPLKSMKFRYDGIDHSEISDDFKKAKMADVAWVVFFYSKSWEALMKTTQDYGEKLLPLLQERLKNAQEWAARMNT